MKPKPFIGVRIVQSPAVAFNNRIGTGGVAILFPPGWQVLDEIELVRGRAIASLVQDRTCQFYILSVYLHPDNRKKDAEDLLRTWRFLTKKTDKAFIAGDFNSLDKHFPKLWEKLLLQFEVTDVNPDLITYRHSGGGSTLDRCLVPEAVISSAKLHPCVTVLISHVAQGHDILKLRVNVRPNVRNNPRHPKHEVIPRGVFMPGKDGTPVHSTSELHVHLLRSATQWVHVPKDVLEDLIVASRTAIVATPSAFPTVNGCYALPRILVQEMIEVVDSCIEGIICSN